MEPGQKEPKWEIVDCSAEASLLGYGEEASRGVSSSGKNGNAKSKAREVKSKVSRVSSSSVAVEAGLKEVSLVETELRTISSVVEARMTSLEQLATSVELCLICNSAASFATLNERGESCETDEYVVMCHDCGECYHTYCLDPPLARKSVLKPNVAEWRCPHCKFCVLCLNAHNESDLVVCDRCDRCFHSYCAKLSPDELSGDHWLCADCKICANCSLPFSLISPSAPPLRRYSLCSDCNLLYESRSTPLVDRLQLLISSESHHDTPFADAPPPPLKRSLKDTSSRKHSHHSHRSQPKPSHSSAPFDRPPSTLDHRPSHFDPRTSPFDHHSSSLHHLPASSGTQSHASPVARPLPSPSLPSASPSLSTPSPSLPPPTLSSFHTPFPLLPRPSPSSSLDASLPSSLHPPHSPLNHPLSSLNHPHGPPHLPQLPLNDPLPTGNRRLPSLPSLPSFAPPSSPHFNDPHLTPRDHALPSSSTPRQDQNFGNQFLPIQLPQSLSQLQQPTQSQPLPAYNHSGLNSTHPTSMLQQNSEMNGFQVDRHHVPVDSYRMPPPHPQHMQNQQGYQMRGDSKPTTSHGRVIQKATPSYTPLCLPPDVSIIEVGKNGANNFPNPVQLWNQMFELSADSYFQMCAFFGHSEAFYQLLPAIFVPGGQFPMIEECPTVDTMMNILLQGATPETVPPYQVPCGSPLPSGTVLLPPRELIQERQAMSYNGARQPSGPLHINSRPLPHDSFSQHPQHMNHQHGHQSHHNTVGNISGLPGQQGHNFQFPIPLPSPRAHNSLPLPQSSSVPHSPTMSGPQPPRGLPGPNPAVALPTPSNAFGTSSNYSQQAPQNPVQPALPVSHQPSPRTMTVANPSIPLPVNPHSHVHSGHQQVMQSHGLSNGTGAAANKLPLPAVDKSLIFSAPAPEKRDIGIPGNDEDMGSFGISPPTYSNGHIDHPSRHSSLSAAASPHAFPPSNMSSAPSSNSSTPRLGEVNEKKLNTRSGSAPVPSGLVLSAPSSRQKRRMVSDGPSSKLKDLGAKLQVLLNGPPYLMILRSEPWDPHQVDISSLRSELRSKYVGYAIPETPEPPKYANDPYMTSEMMVKYFKHRELSPRDNRQCMLCKKVGDDAVLGRLLPYQLLDQWVHACCALWSTDVVASEEGELLYLAQSVRKAHNSTCCRCREKGASIVCAVTGCTRRFHLPCLLQTDSRLVKGPFVHYAICMDHAHEIAEVRWLPNEAKIVLVEATTKMHTGRYPISFFDCAFKLHLSEIDMRQKIAKKEGEVTLAQWTKYIFRSGSLCVTNIGCISTRAPFHTRDYIYPVGYKAIRRFWSWKTVLPQISQISKGQNFEKSSSSANLATSHPTRLSSCATQENSPPLTERMLYSLRTNYEMTIEQVDSRLKATIVAEDDPDNPIESHDLGEAWEEVLARVNRSRAIATNSASLAFPSAPLPPAVSSATASQTQLPLPSNSSNASGTNAPGSEVSAPSASGSSAYIWHVQESSGVNSPYSHSSSRTTDEFVDESSGATSSSSSTAMDVSLTSPTGCSTPVPPSMIVNLLQYGFYWGFESPHLSSHIERLPLALSLDKYIRKHDMTLRLPSVLSLAVARYFDPDTIPDILSQPPNESGAARCQPYVPLPPLERFKQVDAFPCHPASSLVRFKELARTRAKFSQPLYPQTDCNIRGSITAQNMNSYSKLTRFRIMKASERIRLKVLRSKIQGRGLFLMEDACEGEFLIEYVGEVISHRLADEREKKYQSEGIGCYMFSLNVNFVIDATVKGNASRFINHSCEPNCETQIEVIDGTPRIVIYAKHAIRQGEELTYDYHFEPELEKLKCYCGAASCRGYMN